MNLEPLKMCQSCSSGGTNHFQFCLTGPTWLYFVCCTYYFLCTLIYFYNSRNSSRTPVYSMSYNPAENCVLICTVSVPISMNSHVHGKSVASIKYFICGKKCLCFAHKGLPKETISFYMTGMQMLCG